MHKMDASKHKLNKMKALLVVSAMIVAVVASFALGAHLGERNAMMNAAIETDGIQADLVFNRILDGKKLQSLLAKGCVEAAKADIDINVDQDTKLLADFFKGKLPNGARQYVFERDPELANSLSAFKSKYGDSWTEPACKQPSP